MKLFTSMSFCLLFSLGTSYAQKLPDGTDELSLANRETLLRNYEWYQNSRLKPGVPDVKPLEPLSPPYAWEAIPGLLNHDQLEQWAKNAQLRIEDGAFKLEGKYTATHFHENTYDDWLLLRVYPHGTDSTTLVTAPLSLLGNMRVKFTAHILDGKGAPVTLAPWHALLSLNSSNAPETGNPMMLNFQLFPANDSVVKRCSGYIDVEFLRPDTSCVMVSLGKEQIGSEYRLDTIPFRLLKTEPGDVVIGFAEDKLPDWDRVIFKNGQAMQEESGGMPTLTAPERVVLYLYDHPEADFGEVLSEVYGLNCEVMQTTPEALRQAARGEHKATPDELTEVHHAMGRLLGLSLTQEIRYITTSAETSHPEYSYEEMKPWIQEGYKVMKECTVSKDYDSCYQQKYPQADYSHRYCAYCGGVLAELYCHSMKREPDWTIIDREAMTIFGQWNPYDADQEKRFADILRVTGEIANNLTLYYAPIPLTEDDIKYLSHAPLAPETSGKPRMAMWIKTYMDADRICFYPSFYNEDNEAFCIFRTRIKLKTELQSNDNN